jgi:aminomethyltransferase
MGYVAASYAKTGTVIEGELRGKRLPLTVADMPFNPTTYKR